MHVDMPFICQYNSVTVRADDNYQMVIIIRNEGSEYKKLIDSLLLNSNLLGYFSRNDLLVANKSILLPNPKQLMGGRML